MNTRVFHPLTPEDWAIFSRRLHLGPWPLCATLELTARSQDRRDADLILEAQCIRDLTFPVDRPPLALQVGRAEIAFGGALW